MKTVSIPSYLTYPTLLTTVQFTAVAASLLGLASVGLAVSPVQMRGSDFVDASGDRFYIIGIVS